MLIRNYSFSIKFKDNDLTVDVLSLSYLNFIPSLVLLRLSVLWRLFNQFESNSVVFLREKISP